MNIAQISDLHITESGKRAHNRVDTLPRVQQVLADIRKRADTLDVLLITGDIADNEQLESYQQLKACLDDFPLPYYLIPGNHDQREHMAAVFPQLQSVMAQCNGFIQYSVDDYPVRLIALDTLLPGSGQGLLCTKRLTWLEQALQQEPDKPTLIFMHHPPFKTGLVVMDRYALLNDYAGLQALMAPHKQIKLLVCGHVHRSVQTQIAHIPARAIASTAYSHTLTMTDQQEKGMLLDAPKYEIHCFDAERQAFVSHSVSLESKRYGTKYD